MMGVKLLVKMAVMMMAPAALRRHRKQGGEGPPSFSSSLTSSLDGRRVSPLVLGLHGMGEASAPPRLDLSLCLSLFLPPGLLPFHRFVDIWRSITPIGLKPSPRSCGQRRAATALRGAHEGGRRAQGADAPPCLVATSGTVSC